MTVTLTGLINLTTDPKNLLVKHQQDFYLGFSLWQVALGNGPDYCPFRHRS